jgi:hypothetical protein
MCGCVVRWVTPGTRRAHGAACKWEGGWRLPEGHGRCWHFCFSAPCSRDGERSPYGQPCVVPRKGPCEETVGRPGNVHGTGGNPAREPRQTGSPAVTSVRWPHGYVASVWYVTVEAWGQCAWWLNVQSDQH